jgi:hypothetical protein
MIMRLWYALAAAAALWVQPASAATFLIQGGLEAQGNDADTCMTGVYPGEPPCLPGTTSYVGFSFFVTEGLGEGGVQTSDGIHYSFDAGYSTINSGAISGSFHRTAGDWFAGDEVFYNQISFACLSSAGPLAADCAFSGYTNRFSVVQTDPAPVAPVPEPSIWAMMMLGFGFVGGAMRVAKRRQKIATSYACLRLKRSKERR